MTKTIATQTFTAFDAAGDVIYTGRGKIGAAQKAMDALSAYRDAVKAASGYAHGNPSSLGRMEIDGVLVHPAEYFYNAEAMLG